MPSEKSVERSRGPLFPGAVLLIVGFLLLLHSLDVVDLGGVIEDWWPLLLIVVGGRIVWQQYRSQPADSDGPATEDAESPQPRQQDAQSLLHHTQVFGDVRLRPQGEGFRGGNVSTLFGDIDIDLTQTGFATGSHRLVVNGTFGDITLRIPKDAAVAVSCSVALGELQILGRKVGGLLSQHRHANPLYGSTDRQLQIVASQLFGDVRVTEAGD